MSAPTEDHSRQILTRLLALPPQERRALFAKHCDADRLLAQQVAAALVAAGDPQFAADANPVAAVAPLPAAAKVGERIGPYTLLQVVGEGGFGTVFLASQSEPVVRQVALKVLKPGMDSAQVVARFEQERQALAMMDHPNIAKVFDAGSTARGLPYFVMELCRGEPLVAWCDKNQWTIEQRLELFVQICQAVQHAHGKGIIHRDLKPSNILVGMQDGKPIAKVIDFGIAKALSNKLTEKTFFTAVEQVIGTLQYMSPEQAEGSLDIDTRADVYSLGVVLYEVLTGSTPFDDPMQSPASHYDLLRRIRETEPHKPSTRLSASADRLAQLAARRRTEARRLSAQLRGELDWIVMKAIDRDRTRRYATAQELGIDVQRFLDGVPVNAAPPSAVYVFRKFMRRHRAAVLGVAGVAIALVGGAVAFAWQAAEARHQRDQARIEQKRAEDVAALMEDVFAGIDPQAEKELGVPFAEQLRQRLEQSVAGLVGFDGDLATRARLQTALGNALMGLGDYPRAEELFGAALEARRVLLGEDHADTRANVERLAGAELRLGHYERAIGRLEGLRLAGEYGAADLMLGMAYRAAGRLDEAIAALQRECEQRQSEPDTVDRLLALHSLAACYREKGRDEEAVRLFEDVLARRIKLCGEDHVDVLMTGNSLAVALSAVGRGQQALELLEKTRDRMLGHYAADHEAIITVQANIASMLCQMGRGAEAVALLEPLVVRLSSRLAADHPLAVRAKGALGYSYFQVDRFVDALPLLREVATRNAQLFGATSENATAAVINLVHCLAQLQHPQEAVEYLQNALQQRGALGADDEGTLALRHEQGRLLRRVERLDEAVAILEDVLPRRRRILGNENPKTLDTQNELGTSYFRRRDAKAAIAVFEEVLPGRRRVLGPDHLGTIETLGNLGSSYWLDRQFDRAAPLLREALDGAERQLGSQDPRTIDLAVSYAVNLLETKQDAQLYQHLLIWLPRAHRAGALGGDMSRMLSWLLGRAQREARMADAVPTLETLVEALRKRNDPDDSELLTFCGLLATAHWADGHPELAVPLLEDVVARVGRMLGPEDPRTLQQAYNLGVNLREVGRAGEALPLFAGVVERFARTGEVPPFDLDMWRRELAKTQFACDQRAGALQTVSDYVAAVRTAAGTDGVRLATGLSHAGLILLDASDFEGARVLLQECLDLRERLQPKEWTTSFCRVLLGSCLHGLRRNDEARALIVRGADELRAGAAAVPVAGRKRVREAGDRTVAFLVAVGDEAAAAEWRKWREELGDRR